MREDTGPLKIIVESERPDHGSRQRERGELDMYEGDAD